MKSQCEVTKKRIGQKFFAAVEQHVKLCPECEGLLAGKEECLSIQKAIWSKFSGISQMEIERHCNSCPDCKRFLEVSRSGECKKIQRLISLDEDRELVEKHCKDCYPCASLLDLADDVGIDNIEGI